MDLAAEEKTTIGLLAVVALLQLFRIVGARNTGKAIEAKLGSVASQLDVMKADFERWRTEHVAEVRRRLGNIEQWAWGRADGRAKPRGE